MMFVRMKTVIKIDAVGFDDSLLRIYFPTSLTRADRAHVPPTHRWDSEGKGVNSASVPLEDNPRVILI